MHVTKCLNGCSPTYGPVERCFASAVGNNRAPRSSVRPIEYPLSLTPSTPSEILTPKVGIALSVPVLTIATCSGISDPLMGDALGKARNPISCLPAHVARSLQREPTHRRRGGPFTSFVDTRDAKGDPHPWMGIMKASTVPVPRHPRVVVFAAPASPTQRPDPQCSAAVVTVAAEAVATIQRGHQ